MNEQQSELIELCGLWRQRSQSGTDYLAGSLGGARIMIFKNTRKETDNQPDYRLLIARRQRRDDSGRQGSEGSGIPRGAHEPQSNPNQPPTDDSVPF
jgi:hypothetical protein